MFKLKLLSRIVESGLVAVIRAESADEASRIADACAEGGAAAVEITFTVPGTAGVIADLAKRYGRDDILVGAGTVLDPETARIAVLAGAQFVVSPSLSPDTARLAFRYKRTRSNSNVWSSCCVPWCLTSFIMSSESCWSGRVAF